jgi:hypothetical protein
MHRDIDIDIDRVMRSFTLGKSRHIDFGYGLLNSFYKVLLINGDVTKYN